MGYSVNLAIHFCEPEEMCPGATRELIIQTAKAWQELDAAFTRLAEVIQRERIVWSIAKAGTSGFIEKGSYIGSEEDKLSHREYGERLNWGSCGRPYKFSSSVCIIPFKRNLPYQRRIF